MMEKELRQILKEQGWGLNIKKSGAKRYFYARKWKQDDIYISSETNLPKMTLEEILKKITAA